MLPTAPGQRASTSSHKAGATQYGVPYLNLLDHREALVALVAADGLGADLVEQLITAINRLFGEVLIIGIYESERVGWYDREGLDLAIRQIAAMVL